MFVCLWSNWTQSTITALMVIFGEFLTLQRSYSQRKGDLIFFLCLSETLHTKFRMTLETSKFLSGSSTIEKFQENLKNPYNEGRGSPHR